MNWDGGEGNISCLENGGGTGIHQDDLDCCRGWTVQLGPALIGVGSISEWNKKNLFWVTDSFGEAKPVVRVIEQGLGIGQLGQQAGNAPRSSL